ncbi:TPA: ABC transporter permease [Staphylococcus aureus]|nr:ABC transporter permease [Staphylococcus aureus]
MNCTFRLLTSNKFDMMLCLPIHKCVNLFYTFVYHSNLLKIILQGVIIIITYLESFKSLYHKAFYKFVLSVLSLPIFLYAVIKFFFSAKRKNFYANNSEVSEIERALHQKYKYLSQQKSSTQIHKEALKIFKAQSSNTSSKNIERALHQKYKYLSQQKSSTQIHKEALKIFKAQSSNTSSKNIEQAHFSTYFENLLFHKFIMIKVILALPMFILLTIYLQPLVRYIFERIVMAVIVIIGVIVSVFTILYFSPLDAAYSILGQNATKAQIHQFNVLHHLNEPYFIQLWDTIKGVFTFDLGTTYKGNEVVTKAVGERIPITIIVAVLALIVALIIAIPIGIISAMKRNSWLDITLMIIALIGLSIPSFWQGLLFILAFSLKLDILPPSYMPEHPISLILPVLVIGTSIAASITRMTRSSVLEVMRSDYVLTAYAKGLSTTQVVIKHILKNAIIPIVTLVGLLVAELLGGSAVTEQVFNINGIGRYIVQKQLIPDIPAVMGGVVYISIVISLANLIIDIFYALIDPKLRSEINERK